jgi:cell wall-associated NlpC family hydrolase
MHPLSLRRLVLVCALAACAAVAVTVLGTAGPADADLAGRIATKQGRAEALRAAVAAESRRIRSSARGLARAQARLRRLQTDVAAQRAQLRSVEDALVRARVRLTRLVNRQREATDALRENLLSAYRNPKPDLLAVVITARGFTDLLEKADFLKRIAHQNAQIMDAARTSRVAVAKQASRLGTMQARERSIAARIERRRDSAQAVENALLDERARRLAGRDFKRAALRRVQSQLAALRRRQARSARAGIRTDAAGAVQPPPGAPQAVALVIAAANAIAGLPYVYGGGHGSFRANAYDCSGSVSYALAAAGLVSSPMASGPFMSWGDAGPGEWITVYANAGHAFMVVAGWRFDTSALPGGGTRWARDMRGTGGFVARHPPGL